MDAIGAEGILEIGIGRQLESGVDDCDGGGGASIYAQMTIDVWSCSGLAQMRQL